MENFEQKTLNYFHLKPNYWVRYVDDTNLSCPHGRLELNNSKDHINNQYDNIKWNMELEDEGSLWFLDVLVIKNPNSALAHKVCRKKEHTNKYFHL